jgi:hypothetical protein
LFSPNKSIDLLMFSFFPLAALAASFIEYNNSKIQKEIVLFGCLIIPKAKSPASPSPGTM